MEKYYIKIYTDGSDIKGTGKIGYGVYIYHGGIEYKMSGISDQEAFKKYYGIEDNVSNPTMELLALLKTLIEFRDTNLNIEIFADYLGCQNWISGKWKPRKPYIIDMVKRIHKILNKIKSNGGEVKLTWIKGHSGNWGNDQADIVAKDRKVYNEIPELLKKLNQPS